MEIDRHNKILTELELKPFLSISELEGILGVSAATVRRDIDKLSANGVARKVHGGIAVSEDLMQQQRTKSLPFLENRDIAVAEKKAIALEAANCVRDGSIIMIHAGSACFYLGCAIANRNVRVITNSHPLSAYLGEHGTCQLTVGGGDLHREPGIYFDPNGIPPNLFASQFFIGAMAVGLGGVYEENPMLVKVVKEMSTRASEVIVLADSGKFETGHPKLTLPLPFNKISLVITDDGLSDSAAKLLENSGVEYKIAGVKKDD